MPAIKSPTDTIISINNRKIVTALAATTVISVALIAIGQLLLGGQSTIGGMTCTVTGTALFGVNLIGGIIFLATRKSKEERTEAEAATAPTATAPTEVELMAAPGEEGEEKAGEAAIEKEDSSQETTKRKQWDLTPPKSHKKKAKQGEEGPEKFKYSIPPDAQRRHKTWKLWSALGRDKTPIEQRPKRG